MLTRFPILTRPISRNIKNIWGAILICREFMGMIVIVAKRAIGPHFITMITIIKWYLARVWKIGTIYWINKSISTIKIVSRINHINNRRNPILRINICT